MHNSNAPPPDVLAVVAAIVYPSIQRTTIEHRADEAVNVAIALIDSVGRKLDAIVQRRDQERAQSEQATTPTLDASEQETQS